ncbi:MAG: AIPR family protein [Armatimonadota bacterium]
MVNVELLTRIKNDIQADIYYSQNFSNDGQRFLAWYLRNVYLRTREQARDDITDGADDKEIDAVVVDDEKRQVIIIQGKFYSGPVDHQPLQEILAVWLQMKNLEQLQQNANKKVQVKLVEVSDALEQDYDLTFELVTTGTLTPSAQADLKLFQDTIDNFDNLTASIIVVDTAMIQARWDDALSRALPKLTHTFTLEPGKYLSLDVAGFKTVLAAVRLSDCLKLTGIKDGLLFRKNVRQSLGITNKVNRGLKQTLSGETPQFFFLYHNGITALCEELALDPATNSLTLKGLSVVNGCQSLNTILACSEKVKAAPDAHVLFRFYEIPQVDLADKISINTNSQSAVKPRDLRSNDKRVNALKRAYEIRYPDGYLITKRGEERPADKDATKTIDLSQFAKCLMTWHCQRPNVAYNENAVFDKHFDKLFHSDYKPEDILALNQWMQVVNTYWDKINLNDALLVSQSYSKFYLLFTIQTAFCAANNQVGKGVPSPSATTLALTTSSDSLLPMAGTCMNMALQEAIDEYQANNKVFSPQNWLKNKDSILKIQNAVQMYLTMMMVGMPGAKELKTSLTIPPEHFSMRWSAD